MSRKKREEPEVMTKGMTRREFVKGAAIGAAGVGIAASSLSLIGCEPQKAEPWLPKKWDKEADVVIVGAGGTGLCAAIEACTAGAMVTVLEKATTVGGTTIISGGVIQAADTKFQRAAGVIGDTPDAHKEYWLKAAEGIANPELVKELADNAPDNIDWLVAQGLTYVSVYGVDPIPYISPAIMVPRIHVPGGAGAAAKPGTGKVHVEVLYRVAEDKGAEFMLETPVTALIRDPEKGVIGVKAENGGKDIYIKARRGVVLATSSFDHNEEMARAFSPQQLWALQTGINFCVPTNTGDGIRMAMEVGANLAGLGGTIGVPSSSMGIAPLSEGMVAVPGIWVNKYGRRFVNEAGHYAYVMRAVFVQEEHIAWAIFDDNVRKMGGVAMGGVFGPWSDDLSAEITSGKVKTGNTVMALAASIGVKAAQLEVTLAKWNQDSKLGEDTLFHKQLGLAPMDSPPFFATQVTEINLGSCGGVKINLKTQVIDVYNKPIPRLYAGGMVAGGIIGPYYPGSGTAISITVHFGRSAGKNAAAEEPWE